MRGHRTVFEERVKSIDVGGNTVSLDGPIFPFYIYGANPYLRFRNNEQFKKIWIKGEFKFDCRIAGYYVDNYTLSEAQSFDDCFVVGG